MKSLVIFYSVSGQTKYVADLIKDDLNCDEFEIETEEKIEPALISRYYKGTKSMFSKNLPKLKPYNIDIKDYDNIIIGFPNWASMFPPAVKAFIKENDFKDKNIYLFTTYVARGGNKCLENAAKYFEGSSVKNIGKFSLPKSKDKNELNSKIKNILQELNLCL